MGALPYLANAAMVFSFLLLRLDDWILVSSISPTSAEHLRFIMQSPKTKKRVEREFRPVRKDPHPFSLLPPEILRKTGKRPYYFQITVSQDLKLPILNFLKALDQ